MGINARTFGLAFGTVYLVVGIVGFFVTGIADPVAADTGHFLVGLRLNAVHNLVHLLIGAALFFAAVAGPFVARQVVFLIGAAYLVVGVGGFFVTGRPEINILALNLGDHILHIVTALLALAVVAVDGSRPSALGASDR